MSKTYTAAVYTPNQLGNLIPLCLTSLCSPADKDAVNKIIQKSTQPKVSCLSPVVWTYVQSCSGSEGVLCVLCSGPSSRWLCFGGDPKEFARDGVGIADIFYPSDGIDACFKDTGDISNTVLNPNKLNVDIIGEVVKKIEGAVRPKGGFCLLSGYSDRVGGKTSYEVIYAYTSPIVQTASELAQEGLNILASLFGGLGSLLFGGSPESIFKERLSVGTRGEMYTFALLVKALCGDASKLQCILTNKTLTRRKLLLMLLL